MLMKNFKGFEKQGVYVTYNPKENICRIFRLEEVYSRIDRNNEIIVRAKSIITFDYNKEELSYRNDIYEKFYILNNQGAVFQEADNKQERYLEIAEEGAIINTIIPPQVYSGHKTELKTVTIKDKVFKLYLSQEEIEDRIKQLAETIFNNSLKYSEKNIPVFLIVLKGSFLFAAELLKNININCEIHFIKASSYRGLEQGDIVLKEGIESLNIKDRDVYIIEDIVDSGNTLYTISNVLFKLQPKEIKVLTLLDKPSAHKRSFTNITSCFKIPNDFVVGYGLDYDQLGRNLTDIYKLV